MLSRHVRFDHKLETCARAPLDTILDSRDRLAILSKSHTNVRQEFSRGTMVAFFGITLSAVQSALLDGKFSQG